MENHGKRQSGGSLLGGAGFYIALVVCVIAAGAAGYVLLAPDTEPVSEPVEKVVITPQPEKKVSLPVETIPVETALLPRPEPVKQPKAEETAAPAESIPAEQPAVSPVQEEIRQVMTPLVGETAAVFSVEQLMYDETLADWRTHEGVDIRAGAGTPVAAAMGGTVLSVEEDPRLGTTVKIDHGDGCVTTYASLQETVEVKTGDAVRAGSIIGTVGNTSLAEAALGAHLHFAVEVDGQPVDPEKWLGR